MIRSTLIEHDINMMDEPVRSILDLVDEKSKRRLPQGLIDEEDTCGCQHVRELLEIDVYSISDRSIRLLSLYNPIDPIPARKA